MPEIRSWGELQGAVKEILERLDADQGLALAAAASPEFALAELGFVLSADARVEILDRLRLGPSGAAELAELRVAITEDVGWPVDPEKTDDVRRVLNEIASASAGERRRKAPPRIDVDLEPPKWRPGGPGPDGLEAWAGRHPVVDRMLLYRRLSASAPPFGPEHVYRAVRRGEHGSGVIKVSGRQQRPASTGGTSRRASGRTRASGKPRN